MPDVHQFFFFCKQRFGLRSLNSSPNGVGFCSLHVVGNVVFWSVVVTSVEWLPFHSTRTHLLPLPASSWPHRRTTQGLHPLPWRYTDNTLNPSLFIVDSVTVTQTGEKYNLGFSPGLDERH